MSTNTDAQPHLHGNEEQLEIEWETNVFSLVGSEITSPLTLQAAFRICTELGSQRPLGSNLDMPRILFMAGHRVH